MILSSLETWPIELLKFLGEHVTMLLGYYKHKEKVKNYDRYTAPSNPFYDEKERAEDSIIRLLQSTDLRGWHCTRLTEYEISYIRENGMRLPDLNNLEERIRRVQADGLIEERIAIRLMSENQANDNKRKHMIWFLFYPPHLAGQHGIERLLRRWGGEALYNSHERDAETGPILKTIGHPCLIEVDAPISSLRIHTWLGNRIISRYMRSKGVDTGEEIEHEDYSRYPIPPKKVLRFVLRGESQFSELTGCEKWIPPLDDIHLTEPSI